MNPNQIDNQLRPAVEPTAMPQPETTNPIASSQPVAAPDSNIHPHMPQMLTPEQGGLPPHSQPPHKKHRREGWKSMLSTILLFILAPAIALSITAFAFQSYQVDGQSMESTLQDHDRLIVSKVARTWSRITHHTYIPKRGQIIVFNQAGLFDASGRQEKQLIKRVIGLPGERVVVKDGQITIYNKQHPEGYNPDRAGSYVITAPTTPGDVDLTLQPGSIFVCGDNRTNSEDSRYFGPVDANHVVGSLSFRILPIDKAQKF